MWRLLAIAILLSGCSLYQSEARKFLEKQAFEYAGAAAAPNLLDCTQATYSSEWLLFMGTDRVRVYRHGEDLLDVQVIPDEHKEFSCLYRFESEEEFEQRFEAAEYLTLHHMGLSLGRFDFL